MLPKIKIGSWQIEHAMHFDSSKDALLNQLLDLLRLIMHAAVAGAHDIQDSVNFIEQISSSRLY